MPISLSTHTLIHVVLSLVGMFAGLVVVGGSRRLFRPLGRPFLTAVERGVSSLGHIALAAASAPLAEWSD